MLPKEAQESATALQLVDERLYVDKRSRHAFDASDQTRRVLLQLMAEREPDLYEHLHEVAILARAIGRRMGLAGEDLETLVRAAELHDVGKIAVPDAILQKPAELEPGERAIIERHSEVGERILAVAPAMAPVARLVRSSHERYDGLGYPDRRTTGEIPLGARIIAVCDAYDAMTSERPYQSSMAPQRALATLRSCAGSQFDPLVVEAFCDEVATGLMSAATAAPAKADPRTRARAR
jgi:putative nucleotidyltransferase with HDIG domain